MSETSIIIFSNLVTLLLAIGFNAIMVGVRWGEMRRDIVILKEDLHEIKGMFVLKLKELCFLSIGFIQIRLVIW